MGATINHWDSVVKNQKLTEVSASLGPLFLELMTLLGPIGSQWVFAAGYTTVVATVVTQ